MCCSFFCRSCCGSYTFVQQGIISARSHDTFHNYIGRNVTMLGHRADVVSLLELMLLYMHCFCCVRDCRVVSVCHLTFVERVASSKHKLSLSLSPSDDFGCWSECMTQQSIVSLWLILITRKVRQYFRVQMQKASIRLRTISGIPHCAARNNFSLVR